MKQAIGKYLEYLRSVKNSSPHTVLNYGKDLAQFVQYLSPPGEKAPPLGKITHQIIREFVGHLHSQGLQKSSIARKLASLRSFFKYCVRQGSLKENPARLVPTPKLPKRIPSVLSAEEMNGFLNQLGGGESILTAVPRAERSRSAKRGMSDDEGLLLKRDRALLELLYAAGLRVSELTGLNLADMDRQVKMLRVLGKGS
jgi:integrase/recombinase XerC